MTRTVQGYIDETPRWADGTGVDGAPMTRMQWRIWSLAAAGKFFEGMVVFMTGVALPLIGRDWGLDPVQTGVVGAASLFGILVGASTHGGLPTASGAAPSSLSRWPHYASSLPCSRSRRISSGS